jgi:hypothetical protein
MHSDTDNFPSVEINADVQSAANTTNQNLQRQLHSNEKLCKNISNCVPNHLHVNTQGRMRLRDISNLVPK